MSFDLYIIVPFFKNSRAIWRAFGATAIWSGNFIIARGLHESIPPVSLAFYRWLVAVIVFLPFAIKPLIHEWKIIKKHPGYFSFNTRVENYKETSGLFFHHSSSWGYNF